MMIKFKFLFLFSALLATTVMAEERYWVELADYSIRFNTVEEKGRGKIIRSFPEFSAVSALLSDETVARLKADPSVRKLEIDPKRYLMSQKIPYGIRMVQADQVKDKHIGNRTVCIIDSGFYAEHADLQDDHLKAASVSSSQDPFKDVCGHGTHVAGIMAALDNNTGVLGIAPDGKLNFEIIKVFGDDCNWIYASDLVAAVKECRAGGANVISMSLGGPARDEREEQAFKKAFDDGVLSVAAAGNDGDTTLSYPASYDSVISVGAVDSHGLVADFSQKNPQVEFVAPGVNVRSTVPYIETNTVKAGKAYKGHWMENAARTQGVTGELIYGDLCKKESSRWKGRIVICERGEIFFYKKVRAVQRSGGIGAIIFNNEQGAFFGTLGDHPGKIPAISVSQKAGEKLLSESIGETAILVSKRVQPASGYEQWSGTSMAAPHVAAVAALIWSYNPQWSNAAIRNALQKTAKDLGLPGKDDAYGYGLIQAANALRFLRNQ